MAVRMYTGADKDGIEVALVRPESGIKLASNVQNGRIRMTRFTYTTPASGDLADEQTIAVAILPRGARILGGVFKGPDLGNSSKVDIGLAGNDNSGFISADDSSDADDLAKFLSAGTVSGAVFNLSFANTIALGYGYALEKECMLVLRVDNGAWDDGSLATVGHVEYVVD